MNESQSKTNLTNQINGYRWGTGDPVWDVTPGHLHAGDHHTVVTGPPGDPQLSVMGGSFTSQLYWLVEYYQNTTNS